MCWLRYKIAQKSASKNFIKTSPTYFFTTFSATFRETFFKNLQQIFFVTFNKTSKKQILTVVLQSYSKISFKILYKNLSHLFLKNFLQHFLKR